MPIIIPMLYVSVLTYSKFTLHPKRSVAIHSAGVPTLSL